MGSSTWASGRQGRPREVEVEGEEGVGRRWPGAHRDTRAPHPTAEQRLRRSVLPTVQEQGRDLELRDWGGGKGGTGADWARRGWGRCSQPVGCVREG